MASDLPPLPQGIGGAAARALVLQINDRLRRISLKLANIVGALQTPWLSDIAGAGYRLLNTGNVGIGTATPGQGVGGAPPRLDVHNTGAASLIQISGDTDQTIGIQFFDGSAGNSYQWLIYKVASSDDLSFYDGKNNRSALTLQGTTGNATFIANVAILALPSVAPAAGSKQLWYDPADGNRVKFVP